MATKASQGVVRFTPHWHLTAYAGESPVLISLFDDYFIAHERLESLIDSWKKLGLKVAIDTKFEYVRDREVLFTYAKDTLLFLIKIAPCLDQAECMMASQALGITIPHSHEWSPRHAMKRTDDGGMFGLMVENLNRAFTQLAAALRQDDPPLTLNLPVRR